MLTSHSAEKVILLFNFHVLFVVIAEFCGFCNFGYTEHIQDGFNYNVWRKARICLP